MQVQERHDGPATSAKPFLRWAGSKRKTLDRLSRYWRAAQHKRYVEPFAGSACLFFRLAPPAAVLGDNNSALIETYDAVRKSPELIHRRLCAIPRDSDSYYKWRAKDPKDLSEESRAVRFLYLNRNCFNGIYRTNERGQFNVPQGKKVGANVTRRDLQTCAKLLQRATLVPGDFSLTLDQVRAGDFVYLDPPFALESRRMFRQYGNKAFSTNDVPRLGLELERIVSTGADFLLSYADCREARSLARSWHAKRVQVRRHVAGFADHRTRAYEWMISNTPLNGDDDA